MDEAEGGGGPGSKVLLIVGLVLGIALGGGVMMVLDLGAPPPTQEEIDAQKEKERKEKEVPKELFAVEFERLTVGIYTTSSTGRRRYVGNYFIKIRLEVTEQNDKIIVERLKDRLQHAFLSAIQSGDVMRDGSQEEMDADKLSKLLLARAEQVVGGKKVVNVAVVEALRVSN